MSTIEHDLALSRGQMIFLYFLGILMLLFIGWMWYFIPEENRKNEIFRNASRSRPVAARLFPQPPPNSGGFRTKVDVAN